MSAGRVTRLFHQALTDQLLQSKDSNDHAVVYRALIEDVRRAGGWARHRYAAMYAVDHAVQAGMAAELIDDIAYLSHAETQNLAAAIDDQALSDRIEMALVVRQCTARMPPLTADQRLTLFAMSASQNADGTSGAR